MPGAVGDVSDTCTIPLAQKEVRLNWEMTLKRGRTTGADTDIFSQHTNRGRQRGKGGRKAHSCESVNDPVTIFQKMLYRGYIFYFRIRFH